MIEVGRQHPLAVIGGGALLLAGVHLAGLIGHLLPAVPLLLLVVSLLFGLYPGCETVVRLSERIASRGRARLRGAASQRRPAFPAGHSAHGGLLLAFSLSGRAPPA